MYSKIDNTPSQPFLSFSHGQNESQLQLLRPGGIIAVDNTIWSGAILLDSFQDADTVTIRKLNDLVAKDERVESLLLNMADGVLLAIKK